LPLHATTNEPDKAEAFRYALIQAKASPKYIRMAEIYKLRAEYKAGELLREMPKAKGGQPYQKSYHSEVMSGREKGEYPRKQMSQATTFAPTLSEMDIERNQSSSWQRIASIPREATPL